MHNKENNKYKIITQGLRPFSSSIPKTLKKYLRKGGYNYSNIVDNWTTIVNKKISDSCYPISIKMRKEMKNGTLMLNVIHGKELEIEYAKNDIIEKINSFFGYNCIGQINLKIIEEKIKFKKNKLPIIKNLSKINNKIASVQNPELKESLKKFLKAFDERKK
tara:strand:+ start:5 stop:490 length:486 start_codon:yes stop_codon:yes gene_type:complete